MRLLVVGSEADKTIIMDGPAPCIARIRNGEVVEMERRTDAGELIEKWLQAAKRNPIAKKQILKFVERRERRKSGRRDILNELREKGKIILTSVV